MLALVACNLYCLERVLGPATSTNMTAIRLSSIKPWLLRPHLLIFRQPKIYLECSRLIIKCVLHNQPLAALQRLHMQLKMHVKKLHDMNVCVCWFKYICYMFYFQRCGPMLPKKMQKSFLNVIFKFNLRFVEVVWN